MYFRVRHDRCMRHRLTEAMVLLGLYYQTAAALSWSDGAGFRSLEVHPGMSGKAGFTLMNPSATGVLFTNTLQGDAYLTNVVAHAGLPALFHRDGRGSMQSESGAEAPQSKRFARNMA
jgi:hypothetical protein